MNNYNYAASRLPLQPCSPKLAGPLHVAVRHGQVPIL